MEGVVEDQDVDEVPETEEDLGEVVMGMDGEDVPELPEDIFQETPPEKEEVKPDAEIEALKGSIEELKESNRKLQAQIGYEARHAKKAEKKAEDTEAGLSREQLVGILDQNKNDPETLLRVFDYVAEQKAKGAKVEALDAAKIDQERREIDAKLVKLFPVLEDENSPMSMQVESTAEKMRLGNHPFRRYLANAAMMVEAMPQIIAHWKEAGRKEALEGKADTARQRNIQDGKLPSGKPGNNTGKSKLPDDFEEMCKMHGFKTKRQRDTYARLIGVNAAQMTMEG
uniref:Uncharacterized protein n=1 Tax=viral metagenome TaxID=1070528 RepID=A0A6M3II96_9ZZZZ